MGAPRKWIKTLLGFKKSDKLVSREEENSSRSTGKIWYRKKCSVEIDNSIFENGLNQDVDIEFEDVKLQSVWDPGSSPSTSLEVQNPVERQQSMLEEWMATDAAGSPSTSLQVQSAALLNMREERAAIDANDAKFHSAPDRTSPPYASLQVQHEAQRQPNTSEEGAAIRIQTALRGFLLQNVVRRQQNMSEESAAICIQTAFRRFLARRFLRGLKGLVRLQALIRGQAARRQSAIALRCMQALVRVQARCRATHARMALENQAAKQKLKQQQEHETQVNKVEEGWRDGAGSADEIQAKLLKRKEAAAKREKAKAYALARQWQARPKQQATPVSFEPDKSNWGWNWLERWMAVRPWENQISDFNLQEGMKILENESGHAVNAPKPQLPNTGKGKSSSTNISNGKMATSHSDGFGHSPNRSPNASPTTHVPRRMSPRPVSSRPNLGSRSLSSPKERSTLPDKQGNKRLSLPEAAPGRQSAARSSPKAPRPVSVRNKSTNENDVKSSKLGRHVSH